MLKDSLPMQIDSQPNPINSYIGKEKGSIDNSTALVCVPTQSPTKNQKRKRKVNIIRKIRKNCFINILKKFLYVLFP